MARFKSMLSKSNDVRMCGLFLSFFSFLFFLWFCLLWWIEYSVTNWFFSLVFDLLSERRHALSEFFISLSLMLLRLFESFLFSRFFFLEDFDRWWINWNYFFFKKSNEIITQKWWWWWCWWWEQEVEEVGRGGKREMLLRLLQFGE